ncbi:MAG: hypothetical protein WBF52_01220 [Geitlerinemataceae cyanobacterium]
MPISSADPLQTVSPVSRIPPGPVRLFKALYNPTYLAIVASVALHGLAVAALPVVGPMIAGRKQQPRGPLETNILQLTPAEAARFSAAFPAPKTTVLPPGLPSFNSNTNTPPSFSPPPLSGDLSQSPSPSRRGWSSIFGGNPSSETSAATNDPSRVASNWYTGEPEAASSGEYYEDYGSAYTDTGDAYAYSYSPYSAGDGYIDLSAIVGSPPGGSSSSADTKTPEKTRVKTPMTDPDDSKSSSQDTTIANADGVGVDVNSPGGNRTLLGATPGMRTGQSAFQDLEGNYPVLVVVEPNGEAGWTLMEEDKLAEAAIEYTFENTSPSIPSEPGEYILIVTYPMSESETMPEVAGAQTMPPEKTPIDNPEFQALQENNPGSETLSLTPLNIPSPVSGRAKVAVVVDGDGNFEVRLLEGTGNEDLDQQAIAAAGAGWIPVEEPTIQTFEVQFNIPESSQPNNSQPDNSQPDNSQPETKKPIPQPDSSSTPPTPDFAPESTPESPDKPIPKVTPNPSEEFTPEPIPETEETIDSNPYQKPKLSPENTGEDLTEETPIEPSPQVNPKKPRLDRQSALPSL